MKLHTYVADTIWLIRFVQNVIEECFATSLEK
jgi:hypothetical protein